MRITNRSNKRLSSALLSFLAIVMPLTSLLVWFTPVLAATYSVTNTNDSGAGSLRQAILDANANPGLDTITFGIAGTIAPTSLLPAISDPVFMDGCSAPGANCASWPLTLQVELSGVNVPDTAPSANKHVFQILDEASGSTFRGLSIHSWSNTGTSGANAFRIVGNLADQTIGSAVGADDITIQSNYIGTDVTSTVTTGVRGAIVAQYSNNITIGGLTPELGNVISTVPPAAGNSNAIVNTNGNNWLVQNNYIGVGADGSTNLGGISGNGFQATTCGDISFANNIIGNVAATAVVTAACSNIFVTDNRVGITSANSAAPIGASAVTLASVTNATVQGNTIGNATQYGVQAIKQGAFPVSANINILDNHIGIDASDNAHPTLFGIAFNGVDGGNITNNVSSNSTQYGIAILGTSGSANPSQDITISDNRVGTNLAGNSAAANLHGVALQGRRLELRDNTISGNTQYGVLTFGITDSEIAGNRIGVNQAGSVAVSNGLVGLYVTSSTTTAIGGPAPADRNVISGNGTHGIQLEQTSSIQVENNHIGTDVTGLIDVGNVQDGIRISQGASDVTIGGATTAERNVISGNNSRGIHLVSVPGAVNQNITVRNNFIGLGMNGITTISNQSAGVNLSNSSGDNTPTGCGLITLSDNLVGSNGGDGLHTQNCYNLTIERNTIGFTLDGITAAPNGFNDIQGDGVQIRNADTARIADNHIGNSSQDGIRITDFNDTVIENNIVGVQIDEQTPASNGRHGIAVAEATSTNAAISNNTFAENSSFGVLLAGSGHLVEDNTVFGNGVSGIGVFGDSTTVRSNDSYNNTEHGILFAHITGGVKDYNSTATQNTIYGNGLSGVGDVVLAGSTSGIAISQNSIYSNGGLGIDLNIDGVTANDNDTGDADVGSNTLVNFPVITSVKAGSIIISGTYNGAPNEDFVIEFFRNSSADSSGHGEGQTYIGNTTVSTDGSGLASFEVTFPGTLGNDYVSATATSVSTGSTSEFSAVSALDTDGDGIFDPVDIDDDGDGVPDILEPGQLADTGKSPQSAMLAAAMFIVLTLVVAAWPKKIKQA